MSSTHFQALVNVLRDRIALLDNDVANQKRLITQLRVQVANAKNQVQLEARAVDAGKKSIADAQRNMTELQKETAVLSKASIGATIDAKNAVLQARATEALVQQANLQANARLRVAEILARQAASRVADAERLASLAAQKGRVFELPEGASDRITAAAAKSGIPAREVEVDALSDTGKTAICQQIAAALKAANWPVHRDCAASALFGGENEPESPIRLGYQPELRDYANAVTEALSREGLMTASRPQPELSRSPYGIVITVLYL